MNIYKIWQNENRGYDTYDSAVVVAENECEARRMNPSYFPGGNEDIWPMFITDWDKVYSAWASSVDEVYVKLIGTATPEMKKGVVVASFNAG